MKLKKGWNQFNKKSKERKIIDGLYLMPGLMVRYDT